MLLKKKMIPKYIIEDIEISSDSERENSDEENLKNTNITHIMKLIFEACKKYISIILFVYM